MSDSPTSGSTDREVFIRPSILALLARLQKKIEDDAARPVLAWRYDYFAHWPHVKGLVPHNNVYNFTRFQDVWKDK